MPPPSLVVSAAHRLSGAAVVRGRRNVCSPRPTLLQGNWASWCRPGLYGCTGAPRRVASCAGGTNAPRPIASCHGSPAGMVHHLEADAQVKG